jgi:hypothetical protein
MRSQREGELKNINMAGVTDNNPVKAFVQKSQKLFDYRQDGK